MRTFTAAFVAVVILLILTFATVMLDKYGTVTIQDEITPEGYLEQYDAL